MVGFNILSKMTNIGGYHFELSMVYGDMVREMLLNNGF